MYWRNITKVPGGMFQFFLNSVVNFLNLNKTEDDEIHTYKAWNVNYFCSIQGHSAVCTFPKFENESNSESFEIVKCFKTLIDKNQ